MFAADVVLVPSVSSNENQIMDDVDRDATLVLLPIVSPRFRSVPARSVLSLDEERRADTASKTVKSIVSATRNPCIVTANQPNPLYQHCSASHDRRKQPHRVLTRTLEYIYIYMCILYLIIPRRTRTVASQQARAPSSFTGRSRTGNCHACAIFSHHRAPLPRYHSLSSWTCGTVRVFGAVGHFPAT